MSAFLFEIAGDLHLIRPSGTFPSRGRLYDEVFQRFRAEEEEALDHFTSDFAQEAILLIRFNALGQGMNAHPAAHLRDGFHDHAVRAAVVVQVAHQLHVKLDPVDMIPSEHIEGGIARPEIVQPETVTAFVNHTQLFRKGVRRLRKVLLRNQNPGRRN